MSARYTAVRNTFQPTSLVPKPYGWTRSPTYNRADVPSAWVWPLRETYTPEYIAQAMAYEWLGSSELSDGNYSNPPFTSGAAGRLHPALVDYQGAPARILRGFIRRANYDVSDPISKARLHFMYNPEAITREYVSYLDQAALDPFNTVYGSGNLVAPPSFMNFRFDLFFDRQTEADSIRHPGVLVDYQFFDLVVRNVIPTDPNQMSNQLPDNGVMMVNPRDITVVFSPQLTVQGRPINAQVIFEKFTHRMTPIRMRISLEMRVMYFGPMLEQTEYRMQQAEVSSEVSVPIDEEFLFDLTFTSISNADVQDMTEVVILPETSNRNASSGAVQNPSGATGNAQARGWGTGYPNCQPQNMVDFTFKGHQLKQHRGVYNLVQRLLYETQGRGYNIHTFGSHYSCRTVGGGTTASNHSWGLAIDINPSQNPYQTGPLVTDMPSWMPALWNSYGFRWGGTYNTKKDAMHYEFMGTPADAQYHLNRARQARIGGYD